MTLAVWLTFAACGALGFGAGWFGPRVPRRGPSGRLIILGLLPVWMYTIFMLSGGSTGLLREDIAWFILGLLMLSPFFATWLVAFLIAIMVRRSRSRRT